MKRKWVFFLIVFVLLFNFLLVSSFNWDLDNDEFKIRDDFLFYKNLSKNITNSTSNNISFNYTFDSNFPGFSLNKTTGIINFTPTDFDVGNHSVNITAYNESYSVSHIFNFSVNNTPDKPEILKPKNISSQWDITPGPNDPIPGDLYFLLTDDDFNLNNAHPYSEELDFNINIENKTNVQEQLFFNLIFNNNTYYLIQDFPDSDISELKNHIGNYSLKANVTDNSGRSEIKYYNFSIGYFEDSPIINPIPIQRKIINTSFYYDINASDPEDDPENLSFSYELISGKNILNSSTEIFNESTGEINLTLNSSHRGTHIYNITVNDSTNKKDYETLQIEVYNKTLEWVLKTSPVFNIQETNLNNSFLLNLSKNVTGSEAYNVSFNYNKEDGFYDFSLNKTTGILEFIPVDQNVGINEINITVRGKTTNIFKVFTFDIDNIPDKPEILTKLNETIPLKWDITPGPNDPMPEILTFTFRDDDFYVSTGTGEQLNITMDDNLPSNDLAFSGEENNVSTYKTQNNFPADNYSEMQNYVGNYTINITVKDKIGDHTIKKNFNISIEDYEDPPVFSEIENQTTAINRHLYYDINASDPEDDPENLSFSYELISGKNVLDSPGVFNESTGEINLTLNGFNGGNHLYNITVIDSSNNKDHEVLLIKVYDKPDIDFFKDFESNYLLNLSENRVREMLFSPEHSVGDNLTYEIRMDKVIPYKYCENQTNQTNQTNCTIKFNYTDMDLIEKFDYYGDSSNYSWDFVPDFTDETYGKRKNMTLFVYPANTELENRKEINFTEDWILEIAHSNHPVEFTENSIYGTQEPYSKDIKYNLNNHFFDLDYEDVFYDQEFVFNVLSDKNDSKISWDIDSDWNLTLSASTTTTEILQVIIKDTNLSNPNQTLTQASTNTFQIKFTNPNERPDPTPSPSPSPDPEPYPVYLNLITPGEISIEKNDEIIVPIALRNTASETLNHVFLNSSIAKNSEINENINMSFKDPYFAQIQPGDFKNTSLTIKTKTNETGLSEININATVQDPDYSESSKIYLKIKQTKKNASEIREEIMFTEEFIASNPECIEIKELVKRAKQSFENQNYEKALNQSEKALDSCKEAISKPSMVNKQKNKNNDNLVLYLIASIVFFFLVGLLYYMYQRTKFKEKVSK